MATSEILDPVDFAAVLGDVVACVFACTVLTLTSVFTGTGGIALAAGTGFWTGLEGREGTALATTFGAVFTGLAVTTTLGLDVACAFFLKRFCF